MFITLSDATLYATSFGPKGDVPILTLSGWIGSWEDWADTLSILSETRHVIAYDHRGSGVSLAPVESITFDQLVTDVIAVLDAFGVERCMLAAMSMGAAVAVGAALRAPHRFSKLVIVNGAVHWSVPPEGDPFLQGLQSDYARTLDGFVNACVPETDGQHVKRWGRQILGRASQQAAVALYRMAGAIDLRADLGQVAQPTLILHGDADPLVSVESARRLAGAMPNAKLITLAGVGHVPIMTRPRQVAQAMLDFVRAP